jgi:hypothetical protein
MKKLKLFLLLIALISIKSTYAQQNRIFNSDTIFYVNNNWNTKIGNTLVPFDSTYVILQFNEELNRDNIISYLQNHQIEIIDSLYDFKLCRLNSGLSLPRTLDSLTSISYFDILNLNTSCITNSVDPLYQYQRYVNPNAVCKIRSN